jgi:hypothetical protein
MPEIPPKQRVLFWGRRLLPVSGPLVLRHPPQRAFPARNAPLLTVCFAIKNGEQTLR